MNDIVPDEIQQYKRDMDDMREKMAQAFGVPAALFQVPAAFAPALGEVLQKEVRSQEERIQNLLKRVNQLIYDTRHRYTRGRYLHRHKGRAQRGHHHPFQ